MKNNFALLAALAALVCTVVHAQAPARPPLLAQGTDAPDFTALRGDSTLVKLSAFRGQFVLVDFWSTWCGPCKRTMPHMEKLHQKLKDQGLVVLGVCVWDERVKFDGWLRQPQVATSYLKVFDPAGRANLRSIASRDYKVSGIPTFYLIDPEGKVAFTGVGALGQTEIALDRALAAAGFKL